MTQPPDDAGRSGTPADPGPPHDRRPPGDASARRSAEDAGADRADGGAAATPVAPVAAVELDPDPATGGAADAAGLVSLIGEGDAGGCRRWLDGCSGQEAVRILSRLTDEQRERLLALVDPELAAEVVERLPDVQAVDAIEHLDAEVAAAILAEIPSDERVDIIKELGVPEAEAILRLMPHEDADQVRRLAAYDEDVAGGLMITEFLAFPADAPVREVLRDLEDNAERYADYNITYTYVVDDDGRLVGVVPLRRFVLAPREATLASVMIPDPVRVRDEEPLIELAIHFRDEPFMGLPVVDDAGVLVGVVERSGVEHALAEESDEAYREALGIIGGEELRTMPLITRSRRRLAWLSVNIVLNLIAASVIAAHTDTLEAVIALAVFLPIISDMSGCSGNQAVAVSMRELSLGVSRPRDVFRVLWKEVSVGVINGIALGILIGLVAFVWKSNPWLGLVVGGALSLNTIIAVSIGGCVPLVLKGLKMDPALASGPILTTVTDLCGFLLVLTFASLALARLTGM